VLLQNSSENPGSSGQDIPVYIKVIKESFVIDGDDEDDVIEVVDRHRGQVADSPPAVFAPQGEAEN
jgi:hypothetical protein